MSKAAIIGTLFGVVILGVVIYLSMGLGRYTCEVCIDFQGRSQCRSASGADQESAMQTAHSNACAFLITSKTEGFLCNQATPVRAVCQAQ